MQSLVQTLVRLYASAIDAGPELASELRAASEALRQVGAPNPTRPPHAQPVCRLLPATLEAAERGPAAEVARALRPLLPRLHWELTYADDPQLGAFLDNYAYADLIGPRGLASSEVLTVGLLLLGPRTFYPRHEHPAVETYYVLAGRAGWQQAEQPWAEQPPGAWIYHAAHVPHAMATDKEPLLGLYLWRGELAVPAAWSADAFTS